jgi:hypothetical protein
MIVRRRGLTSLGIATMVAAVALLAWQAGETDKASAQAPTAGMRMELDGANSCSGTDCFVTPNGDFTIRVVADPAPNVPVSGITSEVFYGALTWNQRAACEDEIIVPRTDALPIESCTRQVGGGESARHVVITQIGAPPLPTLAVATGDTLVELDFTCAASGTHLMALTAVTQDPATSAPFGAAYFGEDTATVFLNPAPTTILNYDNDGDTAPEDVAVANFINVTCGDPPTATEPAPTNTPLSALPTLVDTGSGGPEDDSSSSLLLLGTAAVLLAATLTGFGLHRWRSSREA